jgi:hypothetical protein
MREGVVADLDSAISDRSARQAYALHEQGRQPVATTQMVFGIVAHGQGTCVSHDLRLVEIAGAAGNAGVRDGGCDIQTAGFGPDPLAFACVA